MIAKLPNNKFVNLKEFTVRDLITLNNTFELSGLEGSLRFLDTFIFTPGLTCFDKFYSLILLRKQCIGDMIDFKNVSVEIDLIVEKLDPFCTISKTFAGCELNYPKDFVSQEPLIQRCITTNHAMYASISTAVAGFIEKHNKPIVLIETKSLDKPIEINFFDESAGMFLLLVFTAMSNSLIREYVIKLAQFTHDIQGIYQGTIVDMLDYIDIKNRQTN